MSELAPGVHRIDTPLGERVNTLWLIRGADRAVLYDTGIDNTTASHVLPYLAEHGIEPATIAWAVVSHADVDHFGGIADVHEHLGNARVAAHALDAALIEDYDRFEDERVRGFREPWGYDETPDGIDWCRSVTRADRIDDRLAGGERFDLGAREVRVHSVPGHTHGSLALHDSDSGAWFVSDAVLGVSVPLADGTPAFAPTYRHVDDYLRTIETLERAAPQLLCTAHYGVFAGDDALGFLHESRAFVDELERVTMAALAGLGSATLQELLPVVSEQVARWPREGTEMSLAFPLVGHLERLVAQQRVDITTNAEGRAVAALIAQ
jgi:glyoxylase-like metal-dependent hydrolase (beta-lactamase superfamily II)